MKLRNKVKLDAKVLVAVYDTSGTGSLSLYAPVSWEEEGPLQAPDTWTRKSEFVEVSFPARKPEDWVPEAFDAINAKEREARNELERVLNQCRDARARLLEITHNPDKEILSPTESLNKMGADGEVVDGEFTPMEQLHKAAAGDDDIPF